jgi:hypothetical protein
MKSPAWGRGAYLNGAGGIGGSTPWGERNFSLGMRAANYTLVCGVSFSWRPVASKTQRLQFDDYLGTKQRA